MVSLNSFMFSIFCAFFYTEELKTINFTCFSFYMRTGSLVVFAAGADLEMSCTVFRLRLRRLMLDLFQSSVLFQKSREGSSDDSHPEHRVSRGNWMLFSNLCIFHW